VQDAVGVGICCGRIVSNVDIHRSRDSRSAVANAVGEGISAYKAWIRIIKEVAVGYNTILPLLGPLTKAEPAYLSRCRCRCLRLLDIRRALDRAGRCRCRDLLWADC
jgi:hypothetical protein